MTIFNEVNPKLASVVVFIIVFLCILGIMVSIALLLEKGNHKLYLILLLITSIILLAGGIFFLLWFH